MADLPLWVVFAKYWQPGAVKTRLAAAMGADPAAALYRVFLETLVRRLSPLAGVRQLRFTPFEHRRAFVDLANGGWQVEEQGGGDLGSRLQQCCTEAFQRGLRRVLILGSDSPNVPLDYLQSAAELLNRFPVVLGPSDDGGYYLVGVSGTVPPIFEEMTWSTPDVWAQTVTRLQENEVPFAELPAWYDVDELNDVERLFGDLRHVQEPELVALRHSMVQVLSSFKGSGWKIA